MTMRILSVSIRAELDVVSCRQRARQIAALCGFGLQDQARIATAASEVARNVYNYAAPGRAEFLIEGETAPQVLTIRIEDQGPGIAELDRILAGQYKSQTGMGVGLIGAQRLMDRFTINSRPGAGTVVELRKLLPAHAPLLTPALVGDIGARLAALPTEATLTEVQQQNRELLNTLAELKARQEELLQLTRELEDTNRGVVALYAELDEKAGHLRRADEMKSRFLSNMSHEFRTPLSSIRALSKLLLDRVDGELTVEQEKQVSFILRGAEDLSELVNDLLDLAKIEAGKIDIRPGSFAVADLFSALRGMLRPLLVSESVRLEFDEAADLPLLCTDEAKLSQILRNFISNALKFTDAGEVRVSAVFLADEDAVRVSVRDTGVGIPEASQQLVFEEFTQIENRLQQRVKGTGLGLPLCRKLAGLLGGRVELQSTLGVGSTFSVVLPVRCAPQPRSDAPAAAAAGEDEPGLPVLVVEDEESTRLLYARFLHGSAFRPVFAASVREAEEQWQARPPVAVLLDVSLKGEDSWRWLTDIKSDPRRAAVPVVLATETDDKRKGLALGADAYYIKPLSRLELLSTLDYLTSGEAGANAGQRKENSL
ncbi:Signal transduction histidine kinase [Noviherbaspirillum suwonense]|uniref:histidine kinase n=2 Tax=Noviherbaspirillum suwonense TaxID=1224511 RepID=A0ABY1QJM9_9BURK|nr:Signal transduction histidine kinase [Noviherbaspirillum suwonense]